MKNVLILFLLCCLAAPFSVTYIRSRCQRRAIRREIKHKMMIGIDQKDLVTFKFSTETAKRQLRWKHSKEFEYRGSMYDITSQEVQGDTVIYHCWPDHKENKLNRELGRLLAMAWGQNQQRREKAGQLLQFIKSLYFTSYRAFQSDWVALSKLRPAHASLHYRSIYLTPPAPPPEFS